MMKALKSTPWPVLLLIVSFLCPTELSVYVAGARLPPHRALLLLLIPAALLAFAGRGAFRLRTFDLAFLGFAVWTVFVYLYHHGPADGLQTGAALAIDSFGSYIVARAYVRDEKILVSTITMLLAGVLLAGLMALPETLGGQIFTHDLMRQITGYVHPTDVEKRMGLTRAFGPFDHPIHLGTFCASSLALALYSARGTSSAIMRALMIAACALTALSSAPMLSIGVQAGLFAYERLTRGVSHRTTMALGGILLAFAGISAVASRSPFALIATGLTLDPWTGFYRLMIWENGLASVINNPMIGLGLNDWERPLWMVASTVDAFWLVIAMRGGIPAFVLLVGGIALMMRGVVRSIRKADAERRALARGWIISLIALALVGCTVHYWNVPFAYLFFFVGLGGAMADPKRARVRSAKAKVVDAAAPSVRWLAPEVADAGDRPSWPVPVPAARMR